MKEQILEISERLKNDHIDYKQARQELCSLFGHDYKPKWKGKCRVNNPKLVYHGHELEIIDLYMVYDKEPKGSPIPIGTRDFLINLEGTEFEKRLGYKTTSILETEMEILELTYE